MTSERASQLCAFMEFIAQILDGQFQVEESCRQRAAQLLKESPRATKYEPPISGFTQDVAEERE